MDELEVRIRNYLDASFVRDGNASTRSRPSRLDIGLPRAL